MDASETMAERRVPKPVSSKAYKAEFYGILNKDGDFWTPVPFASEVKAWEHVRDFWGRQSDMYERCRRDFRIIPVHVLLTAALEEQGRG